MKLKDLLKYSISFILATLLFYLVFRNVNFVDFTERLAQVNYMWVWLSMIVATIGHLLRAYRWNLLLNPFGYELTTGRTFLAVMSGYLANLALPRIGEVTRCGILKRNDGVSMSTALGTVVVDRIFDVMVLFVLLILDFIIEFDMIYNYFLDSIGWERVVENKGVYLSIVGVLVLTGIVGLWLLRQTLQKEFKHPLLQKANEKLGDLVSGVLSIRNVKKPWGFALATIGIWITYFLMSYVIFFAMPETSHLTLGAGLSILAAAAVAMAAPVQGGFGAYHALVSGVLVIYGVQSDDSLFFATLLHTSQVVYILVLGGICMLLASFISKKKPTDLTSDS